MAEQRSPRFVWWTALMVFSSVSLGALVSNLHTREDSGYDKQRYDKWAMSISSISLFCAVLAVAAHFFAPSAFVGQSPEGGVAALNLVMWITGLPSIMDPDHFLATDNTGGVLNANLYFFSWAAFISSLYIVGHYIQSVSGAVDFSSTPKKLAMWLLLSAASIVLLATSSRTHRTNNCKDLDITPCNRNAYAIALGAVVGFFGLVLIVLAYKDMLRVLVEMSSAVVFVIMYGVGVGLITFGEGPGVDIGNQYFSTWIGFSVSVLLASFCVREFMEERQAGGGDSTEAPTSKPEISTTEDGAMETVKVEEGTG